MTTILVVDDEAHICGGVQYALTREGHLKLRALRVDPIEAVRRLGYRSTEA